MGEIIFHIALIILPASILLAVLLVRLFKTERKGINTFIIFILLFGIFILIYFLVMI